MPNVKFEDVYANAYVRESVAYLVATTIRQYPMLANSEKDLEQELWIALARKLPRFQSARSSLNKFCRVILEVSLKEIRRKLFSRRSIVARTSLELTMEMQDFLTWDGLEKATLIFDVQSVLQNLSPEQKEICEMLMDGFSIRQIAQRINIPVGTLYKHQIAELREIFTLAGLKK